MNTKRWALVSTTAILATWSGFIYLVASALGLEASMSVFTSFLATLVVAPNMWRFCEREAESIKGE